uniref:Uncharacterized protein n=1 Tax=Lactuca sativa TaxID=4236 RepID=A0A9R1WA59_LACSA|nr:hypothetical protein LSAT_V11C200087110 [Lactuca sativa]
MRWDFLDDILHRFGFGVRWRDCIRGCLVISMGSVMFNGSPTEEHGDPVSPFLFILVMETLHISFSRAMEHGFFLVFLLGIILLYRCLISFMLMMLSLLGSGVTLIIATLYVSSSVFSWLRVLKSTLPM